MVSVLFSKLTRSHLPAMSLLRHVILFLLISGSICADVQIEQLPSPRSLCGEGPHWDEATQSLYYIDIYGPQSTIHRFDFKENKTYAATVDNEPLMTFVLPVEGTNDEFLIGTQKTAKVIRWDGKSQKGEYVRDAFHVDNIDSNRFNDAKCDPSGRFFGGTQRLSECDVSDSPYAALYSYDRVRGLKQWKNDISISNGLTWVTKTNKFYYVDSCTHDIKEFDYDSNTGDIANERSLFSLKKDGKSPGYVFDGMTSDVEGNLFVTTFGGHKVMKINPTTAEVLAEFLLPKVSQVTSATFGGPNLDILFLTTASRGDQPAEAGHLYKITGLGTTGTPGVKVKL